MLKINGKQHYLWRAVDQDGELVPEAIHVNNLFNLGRHLVRAQHYRDLRVSAFSEWSLAVA
jgi:putative transposase